MCSHIGENGREGPDTKRSMLGNREMVLTMLIGRQSKVTTGLTGGRFRTDRGEASYGDNFLADMVQTDDLRRLPLLKVAANRFTDFPRQFSQGVRFCEDRLPECARNVPALRGLSHDKNQFTHGHLLSRSVMDTW